MYLINSEKFSTKRQLIDALKNTDYDMDLFHFIKAYAESESKGAQNKTQRREAARDLLYEHRGAEDYRYYWNGAWKTGKPSWLAEKNPHWKGNYVVKYRDVDWQKIITGNDGLYQKKILDAGFDGAYLDIIDAFEYFEKESAHR